MSTLVAALALAGLAPAALAQQAPGQEMDHSQHMMQSTPAQAPAGKPAPRGPAPMGMKQGGGMGAMGGMDHDMGGGMGCGMMGGKGGGMGGGKMGGMMGGMGGGMKGGAMGGMRQRGIDVPLHVTGPLSHMDLTPEQDRKILRIQDELRKKHHEVKGRMMDEQVKLRDLYLADKQDKAAILAAYRKLGDLRLQMVEAGLDAQGRIDTVLSQEQREMLKSHHPFWMMESVE